MAESKDAAPSTEVWWWDKHRTPAKGETKGIAVTDPGKDCSPIYHAPTMPKAQVDPYIPYKTIYEAFGCALYRVNPSSP